MELEEAKEAIKRNNERLLERCAERLLKTKDIKSVVGIPEDIQGMLLEGRDCFLYLNDSACVIKSSGSLELALKMRFVKKGEEYADYKLYGLIEEAKKSKIFNNDDVKIAHEIRKYRNVYVHADLKEQLKYAQIIRVRIQDSDGLEDKDEKKRVQNVFQLMKIKPEHARFCLINSYHLIRKLYPLPEDMEWQSGVGR
jgi:hypothetical protein